MRMHITIVPKADPPTNRRVGDYVIDNIFDPPKQRRSGLTVALKSMAVGESLLIEHEQIGCLGPTVRNCRPSMFSRETQEHGVRVWRVA